MRLSLRRSWTRLLMDFSRTLSGITIEGRSPLPMPRYREVPLKTFRHDREKPDAAAHLRTYLPRAAHSSAVSMERKKVGEVFHFYGKIGVAAIRLTDSTLAIGDTVQIQGPTTNIEQTVDTLQIEHAVVARACARRTSCTSSSQRARRAKRRRSARHPPKPPSRKRLGPRKGPRRRSPP